MNLPEIVSPEQWRAARVRLLAQEKAATKARDALNADRRRLPMVRVESDYRFHGPDGELRLPDLFDGRRQLVVYHFMFDPEWDTGCPSCSAFVDQLGDLTHLRARDTNLVAVSRAPWEKIEPFQRRMGWTVPWYSSNGTRFNHDFHVTHDESVRPIEYNYRSKQELDEAGVGYYLGDSQPFELPGLSVFLRDGDAVFHTYSTYARGMDGLGSTTSLLDLTPLGRQEEWEEPKGRATEYGAPAGSDRVLYHDEY
ncbi:MAG: DUF899 domain-containing protein [Saccharopolyspora sp.]|uniref:DUF899 domain-containing protein n=1 Tax=Saccharopolyspora TaxID=1835 RepID=UPI00190D241D|nr:MULTISPECIES: DUF899 domain-containing protein [unclassified Saccharopolyspora]MBK0869519.1 DUF899 domain-containing protein [Saccharopolyspora sp. HNM0986]MBQ6644300.1 DUF899 domain-containing protein [Saccharopolyspora sp.]